ncbi:FGGY family carbohydrate kinase [Rhizobium sp. AG855]|uniref:FGGY family carbohydrate kinase n=1 Tax=Rhizobium sp. AG855 TaxID=2183898 RepID=UPI000E75BB4C|nr:FGGY family carbohydrate kinase [Rhizobium sp. AG855]RKE83395.1 sugar (pentulose or hexulose) kinase [Rhizobium sp. AG855]
MIDHTASASICVLDVGKTNVKLNAMTATGDVVETLSIANPVRPGPPWQHHDLAALGDWVFEGLATLARRHPIKTFVSAAHGSGGVLVGSDPDAGDGAVLPMIDYEQPLPSAVREAYAPLAGSFRDRGSAIMHGATHQARQMLWMEMAEPERFATAHWFLCLPQYWAWRMTGSAVSEASCLGAQSHLWNIPDNSPTPIVTTRGWERLLPPFAPAWSSLGPVRPALAQRFGLPRALDVLVGIHDSSANLYRYQAAGLTDAAILSTGTWIVGMSRRTRLDDLDEAAGMTINSDVFGHPVAGALAMGGREFVHVAGEGTGSAAVDTATVIVLIGRGTMAVPSFGDGDGFFPGSARLGHVVGPEPQSAVERRALALIYVAQLSAECLDALKVEGTAVLDGTYLKDPLFAPLVAAFRGRGETLFNLDAYGVATGAALLASHGTSSASDSLHLRSADVFQAPPDITTSYHRRWRELARQAKPSSERTFP